MMQSGKTIFAFTIAILLMVGLPLFFVVKEHPLTAKINIEAVPSGLSITINDKPARQGTNKVRPGAYKIVGSREGFASQSVTISVSKGDNEFVGLALLPNSPSTNNWYTTHPIDQQKSQDIASKNSDATAQQALQNVPIIKNLPYIGPGSQFRIDYGSLPGSDPTKPVIYIHASSMQNQQYALAWIRSRGYDPAKLKIVYTN